ncbi:MAG TPA: phytanoyl-CoA dioxygenase family protein [Candidatus Acidoferrum sp.]|nr:phytanoyl-CoA dioxygenase family protein [Candidatus Acidoferrum sp.]
MLTKEQREEFDRSGIMRLPGAIAPQQVKEMLDCVWDAVERRAEVRRDDPSTWKAQRMIGLRDLPDSLNFQQVATPTVCNALDGLFETRTWERPQRRFSMLVAFPESSEPWDVPSQGWHLDYPVVRGLDGNFAVRIFVCLQKLSQRAGGTLFLAGSHRLSQSLFAKNRAERMHSADARRALIRSRPWIKSLFSPHEKTDRVKRFMKSGTMIGDNQGPVVEMTGEPGDVFVTHPYLLHAASTNCSKEPRIVLSGSVFRDPEVAKTIYGSDAN